MVERFFINHIKDDGSRRRGAVEMDSRMRRTLSGVMVASMAERPGKVGALVSALKMDWWKMAATTHESASDRCIPQT